MSRVLSLQNSGEDSLLDGLKLDEFEKLIEKTDESLVKKRKNLPRNHGDESGSLNKARVKGELASYAYPMDLESKMRVVERFAGEFEHFFNHKVYKDGVEPSDVDGVPRHPWMRLKEVRENELGDEDLGLDRRYALRVVKCFYAEKWRELGG